MKARMPVTAPIRVALRAACLIAVAVGVFGLHTLANCGMTGMTGMPGMPGMPGMTATPMVAMTQTPEVVLSSADKAVTIAGTAVVAGDLDTVGVGTAKHGGGIGMLLIEWCLAVFVMGLGAVLWVRRHRRGRAAWLVPRFGRLSAHIERTGRHLPALSLSERSLLRC